MRSPVYRFEDAERFWRKVRRGGEAECWEWQAYRRPDGYGEFGVGKGIVRTHRFAWQLANGPIPSGLWVLHRCDNRPCVNPAHLFAGTPLDNARDMIAKGRNIAAIRPGYAPRGERQGSSKLTAADVIQIRGLLKSGRRTAEIAAQFAITDNYVRVLGRRVQWAHLPEEVTS